MNVVVVGGGLIGVAIAARLGTGDTDVTLCERSSLGSETTEASAGMFLRGTSSPTRFDQRLLDRAWSTYEHLLDDESITSTQLGSLFVAESDDYAATLEEAATTLQAYGVDATFVDASELHRFGVETDGFTGGLSTASDTAFEPQELVDAFAERARERGVELRTGTDVTDVVLEDGSVAGVETEAGRLEADVVVNAAGPWAPALNDLVGVSLPLAHTLGPMLALEGRSTADLPFTIFESRRYLRPVDEVTAYFGAFTTDYVEGQRYEPTALRIPEAMRTASSAIDELVPGFTNASIVDEWAGLRTVTPDGRPIVGETDVPGFLVACGPTGLGITLAPAIADVVAGLLEGTSDRETRVRLSPDRF